MIISQNKTNIKKNVLTLQSSSELNNTNIIDDSIFEFEVNRNLLYYKIVNKMTQGEIQKNLPPQPTSQLSSVFQTIKKHRSLETKSLNKILISEFHKYK